MSEYNRHKWAMEWMHGGGRDPNGRSLDDEIRIGKEDWMERQRVVEQPIEQAPWDKPQTPWWEEKHEPGPWDAKEGGRIGFDSGQLVQPGPGRQGYQGKDIKFGSGTDTSAMDNPKYYKTVRAELNKIKKQRHKVEFFDWKEGDDWYKALSKRLGGMNREHMNKLLNKVVAEEFPLAYAGRAGREAYKNDTVVRAFLGHLEAVGEFDGNEKITKILEQFQSTHPDHKFEQINKAFKGWAKGDFEVRGVDRSKLTKTDLNAIKNWKPQAAGNRTLIREQQLKYLHGLNDTLGNRNLKTIESMFKKKFPNAPENAFWHRVDQLNQLKRTGKVISGLNTTKSYKWNSVGERSNWLKEGFGAQFQGNYNKLINKADKLAAQGNRQGANRLYAAADKFFGPDGIFTKAGGQGEHPLSRLMGGVDQELKINSLVRGDLNQWKRLNFDDPVMKLMNDYQKTKPGSPERKKIIEEIENRKKLMNILTEGPNEKGIVESVQFRYGDKGISPSSNVVPIDQVKNFDVKDYVTRGESYLTEFTKKGGKVNLLDEGTIMTKSLGADQVTKLLKRMGYGKGCKASGGRVGFAEGDAVTGEIKCIMDDVKKTKADLNSPNKEVRRLAVLKNKKATEVAEKIPEILKILRRGAQRGAAGISSIIGGYGGLALEGVVEGAIFEWYKREGYTDKQAYAETFTPRLLAEGVAGKSTEDVPWYGGAEKLLEKELIGTNEVVQRYVDNETALADAEAKYWQLDTDYKVATSGKGGSAEKGEKYKKAMENTWQEINRIEDQLDLDRDTYNAAKEKQETEMGVRAIEYGHYGKGDPTGERAKEREERRHKEFLDYRKGKQRSFYLPKGKLQERVEDPLAKKPYTFLETEETLPAFSLEPGMRFLWDEIPRYQGEEGTKRKWQDLRDAGGWDLMDKIGLAGGVANMAEGGIASLKKK